MPKLIAGSKAHKRYRGVAVEECIGKTIEAVSQHTTSGSYDTNEVITLHFSDGTKTGFVIQRNDDD